MEHESVPEMANKALWKKENEKNGDAIIAVDESGYSHMVVMVTSDEDKIRLQSEYDALPDQEPRNIMPGLYWANMRIIPSYDELEIIWSISKPIYSITMNDYIILIVNSYNFNRNVFCATTSNYEVVEFDPFVGGAIKLTDEQYYSQEVAKTIVGHKFVVKSLKPLPNEVVFTTWKGSEK